MKREIWIRIIAVILALLLLWWLFWAIMINEDNNEVDIATPLDRVEAIE